MPEVDTTQAPSTQGAAGAGVPKRPQPRGATPPPAVAAGHSGGAEGQGQGQGQDPQQAAREAELLKGFYNNAVEIDPDSSTLDAAPLIWPGFFKVQLALDPEKGWGPLKQAKDGQIHRSATVNCLFVDEGEFNGLSLKSYPGTYVQKISRSSSVDDLLYQLTGRKGIGPDGRPMSGGAKADLMTRELAKKPILVVEVDWEAVQDGMKPVIVNGKQVFENGKPKMEYHEPFIKRTAKQRGWEKFPQDPANPGVPMELEVIPPGYAGAGEKCTTRAVILRFLSLANFEMAKQQGLTSGWGL